VTLAAALLIVNTQTPLKELDVCFWCGHGEMAHEVLCPLWLAEKRLELGKTEEELSKAWDVVEEVRELNQVTPGGLPAAVAELARTWPHKRDRGYYIRTDGSGELLWDSGCGKFCERCSIDKLLAGK